MIRLFVMVLIFWFATPVAMASESWSPIETNKEVNSKPRMVLFIGNSYTFFNNLDVVLREMAVSAKPSVKLYTVCLTKGGATQKKFCRVHFLRKLKCIYEYLWIHVSTKIILLLIMIITKRSRFLANTCIQKITWKFKIWGSV